MGWAWSLGRSELRSSVISIRSWAPAELKSRLRAAFQGLFILAGGFDRASAESALKAGQADLIAFARPFLANPDLVERMRADAALNVVDMATFYTPGPKGYADYPAIAAP